METIIEELDKELKKTDPEELGNYIERLQKIISEQEERRESYYWNR